MEMQLSDLPIFNKKAGLILPELVKAYGVTREVFSEISGISPSLLSKNGEVTSPTRMKLNELVSIYSILWKLFEGNELSIKRWLNEPQDQCWGISPVQFMKIDREKNIHVILRSLQNSAYGEAMGA